MIFLDGIARSGTSLLARLMAMTLKPQGYAYYYEPFKHETPAGLFPEWEAMMHRVLVPGDSDSELEKYLEEMSGRENGMLFWKEIRLTLKQDWLLARFPEMRIVHITRDILGVFSSHRRPTAPDWMDRHREIWQGCLPHWSGQLRKLRDKGVRDLNLLEKYTSLNDIGQYALVWTLNEAFVRRIEGPRLLCVRYEDLCLQPREVMGKISDFLDVRVNTELEKAWIHEIVESEVSRDPSGPGSGIPADAMPEVWRERLKVQEIKEILAVASPTRKRFRYPQSI